jgi:hypothetical protein
MTQKIIEVVGTSKESFAKAAENAVAEAAKTVRGIQLRLLCADHIDGNSLGLSELSDVLGRHHAGSWAQLMSSPWGSSLALVTSRVGRPAP